MVPVCSFLNLSIVFAVLRIHDAFLAFNLKKIESFYAEKVFILVINYALRTPICYFSTSTVSRYYISIGCIWRKHIKTRQIISNCLLAPLRFRFRFHVNSRIVMQLWNLQVALAKAGCMQIWYFDQEETLTDDIYKLFFAIAQPQKIKLGFGFFFLSSKIKLKKNVKTALNETLTVFFFY